MPGLFQRRKCPPSGLRTLPPRRSRLQLEELESRNAHVEYFQLQDEHERRIVTLTLDTPSEQLLAELGDLEFVQAVQWRR